MAQMAAKMGPRLARAPGLQVPSASRHALGAFDPKLVVFDKDGTLIDFKFMWSTWAERLCANLERKGTTTAEGSKQIADALGFDRETGDVHNLSPLCCTPMHLTKDICADVLASIHDVRKENATEMLMEVWDLPHHERDVKQLTNLPAMFDYLRHELDMKIAVCTTDDRSVTVATLEALNLDVDAVLCGDDREVLPKPSPEQLFFICDLLGVPVDQTIMVGDTITDMKMARAAQVALSVGIPNGAGSTEDLFEHADIVLPKMDNFGLLMDRLTKQKASQLAVNLP